MSKIKVVVNTSVYLGQTTLGLSKIVMYEFHYGFTKLRYGGNLKLCYMDTDSLVYHVKTKDFYAEIANDIELRFNTT